MGAFSRAAQRLAETIGHSIPGASPGEALCLPALSVPIRNLYCCAEQGKSYPCLARSKPSVRAGASCCFQRGRSVGLCQVLLNYRIRFS